MATFHESSVISLNQIPRQSCRVHSHNSVPWVASMVLVFCCSAVLSVVLPVDFIINLIWIYFWISDDFKSCLLCLTDKMLSFHVWSENRGAWIVSMFLEIWEPWIIQGVMLCSTRFSFSINSINPFGETLEYMIYVKYKIKSLEGLHLRFEIYIDVTY